MNGLQRMLMAYNLVKAAHEEPLNPLSAGVVGALSGPIGTSVYEHENISEPSDRWGIVGRGAIGGSVGGGLGWAAGIPVSLATGIPILPSLAGSVLGGMVGSGVGAYQGAREFNKMLARHHDKPSKKEHDEHHA